MSKKKNLTKEEQEESKRKLQERKDRAKTMGYKWSPCKYCGQTVKHRGDAPSQICGQEDCKKKMMKDEFERRRKEK